MSALLALGFERQGYLWLLLLPALLLWLARRAERPPEVPIGTLALWLDVQELHGAGARARQRVPPWAWCVAGALLCATGAAAGLRGVRAAAPRTWSVVVDLSPSMQLALAGGTRLDAALARAEEWLAAECASGDRVLWLSPGRETRTLAPRTRPGSDWFAPAPAAAAEPDWAAQDRPGTVWVTDRAPAPLPRRAWLCASGGDAVPGAIAGNGRELVFVDERGQLVTRPAPSAAGVHVRGTLPPVLERALRAWADARGYALGAHPDQAVLTLELAGAGEARPAVLALGGWRAQAELVPAGPVASGEQDLWRARSEEGQELVALRGKPGRLRVYLRALAEPEGDPAAFALTSGQLFDGLARPREEVVALEERAAAGPAVTQGGEPPPRAHDGDERGPVLDAVLAGLAALLALLAARLARA